jgi:polyhydroxyalkanoate synthesis regulator phasin
MLPYLPRSEHWLASAKTHFGLTEDHPKGARILEILRKKEAGDITIEEHKEFLILNDELLEAHEAIHGRRLKAHTREEIAAAVDWMFDADKNEAEATSARIAALEQQVLQQVQKQGIGWPPRWIQLAQSIGMDERHPALRNLLEGLEKIPGKITWKEWQAEMNDLLGVMEEAWKKKISHFKST